MLSEKARQKNILFNSIYIKYFKNNNKTGKYRDKKQINGCLGREWGWEWGVTING